RMISQPPPADAFRQDVARFGPSAVAVEPHLVDPLEPVVPRIVRTALEDRVHPFHRRAGHHPSARVAPPREILRQAGLGRRRLEQPRSEEHTSELQSRENLVCRLLLEKKKKIQAELN